MITEFAAEKKGHYLNPDALLEWRRNNPKGYFIELYSSKLGQLHLSTCTAHFDEELKDWSYMAHTGCSKVPDELVEWGKSKKRKLTTCEICLPNGYANIKPAPPLVHRILDWPFPAPTIVSGQRKVAEIDVSKPEGVLSKTDNSSDEWTEAELEASVKVYLEMLQKERIGTKYTKKKYYESLSNEFGRSEKAFEYRMQNISYVLTLMGRDWIFGLKPAKNVGVRVASEIEELIAKTEGKKSNHIVAFELAVREDAAKAKLPKPEGNSSPKSTTSEVTNYQRDAKVKAWVLKQSQGICESCGNPSPFRAADGVPYLEVHHIRHMADGGSDRPENAVALCPNCHREIHYGVNAKALVAGLYERHSRLIRE